MKKFLSMLMLLLAVTVVYKDGSHQVYHWAVGYRLSNGIYMIYPHDATKGQLLLIPADKVASIQGGV
jgi:hypothetical protein